jgi:hypothetical protein
MSDKEKAPEHIKVHRLEELGSKQVVRWVLFTPDANAIKGPLPQGYRKVEDIPNYNPVGNNSDLNLALEF